MELTTDQQVFTTHLNHLVTSIQSSVSSITDKCRSKNLVVQDVYDEIHFVEATPGKKARILLQAVRDCMKHNQACFEEFLGILATELIFDDLIKQLESAKEEAVSLSQDQVVPDGSTEVGDDLFDVPNEETGVARRRTWKDSGFQSASVSSQDGDCPDREAFAPHPSGTMAQVSRDSGISRGSSADLNEPVQETPEGHESSSPVDSRHQQQASAVPAESPRIRAINRMASILRNLYMDTKQQEAMEFDLKDKVTSLSKQLKDTVREKEQTEEALAEKTAVVKYLERKQDTLVVSLQGKESMLEKLKSKHSITEADRDELRKMCTQYEQDIDSLKTELATVSAEHDIKLNELAETKEILKNQSESVDKLRSNILALEQENSVLSYKYVTESEQREEMLDDRRCLEKQNLCFVIIIVLGAALILHLIVYYVNSTGSVETACRKE